MNKPVCYFCPTNSIRVKSVIGSDMLMSGRRDWIRTSDLYNPNVVRYQTAPRADLKVGENYHTCVNE